MELIYIAVVMYKRVIHPKLNLYDANFNRQQLEDL